MNSKEIAFGVIVAVILTGLVYTWTATPEGSFGNQAPDRALINSSQDIEVGPAVVTLFSNNEFCAARAISTVSGDAITVAFSGTASSTHGHILSGTTTTAFEAGIYGCGAVSAWASASTTVTADEFIY